MLLLSVVGGAGIAAARQPGAAEPLNHAGVVVRGADGALTYAYVAFAEPTLNGVELLRRTGIPLVTAGFGGLGEAVCTIDGAGCGLAECQRTLCQTNPNAPFWHYFQRVATGGWQLAPLGPSAATIADGGIDGWSWTNGPANLPELTLPELAARAGSVDGESVTRFADQGLTAAATDPRLYAAAAGVLIAIAAGAVIAARRRERGEEA